MRRIALLLCALLLLIGCTTQPSSVEPGDGPASESVEGDPPMTEEPSEEPTTTEPSEEPTEEPSAEVATFKEKYTYTDGVGIEVTKISHGKLSKRDADINGESVKAGDDWVTFTIRVRNGSKKTVELSGSPSVSYGPDGDGAETVYLDANSDDLSGKLLPGKSRSGTWGFAIPANHQGDVVLEVAPDYEHDSAVVSGSVK